MDIDSPAKLAAELSRALEGGRPEELSKALRKAVKAAGGVAAIGKAASVPTEAVRTAISPAGLKGLCLLQRFANGAGVRIEFEEMPPG